MINESDMGILYSQTAKEMKAKATEMVEFHILQMSCGGKDGAGTSGKLPALARLDSRGRLSLH